MKGVAGALGWFAIATAVALGPAVAAEPYDVNVIPPPTGNGASLERGLGPDASTVLRHDAATKSWQRLSGPGGAPLKQP